MHRSVTAIVDTTYGPLLACADNRHGIAFRTADPHHDTGAASEIIVSRVAYHLRLDLVDANIVEPSNAWGERAAELPVLDGTGFVIRQGVLMHALLRVNYERLDQRHATSAAQTELKTKLLPQLAAWLGTDTATALLGDADRRDLDDLATEAAKKATVLRATADELDALGARATAGEDLEPAIRHGIRFGFRLAD